MVIKQYFIVTSKHENSLQFCPAGIFGMIFITTLIVLQQFRCSFDNDNKGYSIQSF